MQRRKSLLACLLAFALFTTFAAGCDSADVEPQTGTVTGTLFYPDGVTPLGGATVTLADAQLMRPGPGQEVKAMDAPQARTDSEGRFTLDRVPAGEQLLVARRGLFEVSFTVAVSPGAVVEAPPQTIEQVGALASIPGNYDSMQEIGAELNIEIDVVNASLFDDLEAASAYGMIFLNCATQISGTDRRANALAYMQNGGTLYASDLSGGTASALVEGLQTGSGGTGSQTITAEVTFDDLEDAIGRSEVTITYNLSGWHRIQEAPAGTVELLRGTRAGQDEPEPLAVVIPVGAGQLVFTTFHNTAGLEEDQREALRFMIGVGGEPL
jgi:hypothetical protein